MRRSHNPTETQVYFVLRERSAQASAVHREPVERQRRFWADRFRDAGWQTARFLDGMERTKIFYSQEVVQVRTDTWSKGRVVLVGELNRHGHDLPTALANYDTVLRPFVDEIQAEVKPRLLRLDMPGSRLAVDALHAVTALACRLRVPDLVARHSKTDRGGGWRLPDMPKGRILDAA
ncbi:hypothetical protein [Streptomyces sp. NPDC060275]|uniref:hypothetical protein n=1 Tax=Streptomyces sp. NPDC060275 TaxID=3347090 RepID=UPI0036519832